MQARPEEQQVLLMSTSSDAGGAVAAEAAAIANPPATASPDSEVLPQAPPAPPIVDDPTTELRCGTPAATGMQGCAEPAPGTLLCSRYLLEEVIGRGATSSVYRARDLHRARSPDVATDLVAVKVLRTGEGTDGLNVIRLQREYHKMRALSHPGIARVFELGREGAVWFMSMQLVAGQTLSAWMARGGHAPALQIIDSCCDALDYSHSMGVVHGDLKPTNVLVTDDGAAVLIDFGSSSVPGSEPSVGSDLTVAATRLYASPQLLAGESIEQRDDVFSLACLGYGLLSGGRHPYGGRASFEAGRAKSAPSYDRAIPVELFEVLRRALSAERDRRPASVREFQRELQAAEQRRRSNAYRSACVPASADPLPRPLKRTAASNAAARTFAPAVLVGLKAIRQY
jgi:serine/threonine-protein kinase